MTIHHAAATSPEAFNDELGFERLVFFSDAVFAIAVTLLAIEIRLPAGDYPDGTALLAALIGLWPRYLSYTISFFVIGLYWIGHHRMFRLIARYDRRLLFLNLVLLLWIAFIPFPTAVVGEHTGPVATIFYALTMAVTGGAAAVLWWYASGKNGRLLARPLAPSSVRANRLRTLVAPAVFLASVGIALWNDDAARLSWIALAPIVFASHSFSERPGGDANRRPDDLMTSVNGERSGSPTRSE